MGDCKAYAQGGADRCYQDVIQLNTGPDLCKSIMNQSYKDFCYYRLSINDTIEYQLGINANSYCEKILTTAYLREDCEARKAIKNKAETACDRLDSKTRPPSSYMGRSECFYFVGIQTRQQNLCQKAGYLNDSCWEMIAEDTKNASICDAITDKNERFLHCYSKVAAFSKNASVCDTIDDPYYQDACISNVAHAEKNATLCLRIKTRLWQDQCRIYVSPSVS